MHACVPRRIKRPASARRHGSVGLSALANPAPKAPQARGRASSFTPGQNLFGRGGDRREASERDTLAHINRHRKMRAITTPSERLVGSGGLVAEE
mmetsp:Transcript_6441/g.16789  ORF Transcript_6441/g.16789 Transcript_6441/m.16789 type:complete len:95 (+) Transcript_6441:211-495(+)